MNAYRGFVTFDADFPDDSEWNDNGDLLVPGGQAITKELRKGLEHRGCSCTEIDQHSFYGWSFDATHDCVTVFFVLATVEEKWLLQVEPERSLLSRLMCRSNAADVESLQMLIHEVLHSDKRISTVLWYTREDYWSRRADRASRVP